MKRLVLALALAVASCTGVPAFAANCSSNPFTLTNGQNADATQVMANFNNLLNCANLNLAHNAANSDITSLSGLTTPLSVGQGGTGQNTLATSSLLVGNGTSGLSTLAPQTSGNLAQSNGTAWVAGSVLSASVTAPTPTVGDSSGRIATTAFVQLSLPSGTVLPYAGSTAPAGFLFANGQAVSRTTYSSLFAAIGTTFGSGDGSTTFNVPDLRGRVAAGVDNMGGIGAAGRLGSGENGGITGTASLGVAGGEQGHVQTLAELVPHTHPQMASTLLAQSGPTNQGAGSPGWLTGGTTGSTGGGNPFNVVQPTLVLNYIIKE